MHAIRTLILTPTHGHTYRTDAELLDDWHAGQPFVALDGPLCNHRDIDGILHHMRQNVVIWNQRTQNMVPLVSCIAERIPPMTTHLIDDARDYLRTALRPTHPDALRHHHTIVDACWHAINNAKTLQPKKVDSLRKIIPPLMA